MVDTFDRLRNEAVDLAALLVVWLLLTPTVGTSGSNLLALTPFETRPLQTPLVVAGVILALLALLSHRPTVTRAAALFVVDTLLALVILTPLVVFTDGAVVGVALLDAATTAVAIWVVFGSGYRRVVDTSRAVLVRLTRQPAER